MGPAGVLSAPDMPHVGPMNLAIRAYIHGNRLHHNQLEASGQFWRSPQFLIMVLIIMIIMIIKMIYIYHACTLPAFHPLIAINTLRPRPNGRHSADHPFRRIFLNETVRISIEISLKLFPKDEMNNIPALAQIMAWRRPGDKPLSEPMTLRLPTHICVTLSQWVKYSLAYWVYVHEAYH